MSTLNLFTKCMPVGNKLNLAVAFNDISSRQFKGACHRRVGFS